MKKIMAFLLIVCLVSMAALSVACNFTATPTLPNDSSETSGNNETAMIEYTAIEQSIIDAAAYDFTSLKTDTVIPEDAVEIAPSTSKVELTGGTYVLSGEYGKGITITAETDVHIYLNGATITNSGKKALSIEKGNTENEVSITITVVDGTTNTIFNTDSKNAFDSNIPVYINGSGTLDISSTGNNALKADAAVFIVDATVNASSTAKNAISVFSLTAKDCTINVSSTLKDGIHAEMSDEITAWTYESGYVALFNVEYTANVAGDGIQADTFVYIDGGNYDITTTASFVSYSEWQTSQDDYDLEADDFKYAKNGDSYIKKSSKTINSGNLKNLYAMTQSYKGIKVGEIDYEKDGTEYTVNSGNYYIIIANGTFNIDADDDAIHANGGNVTISGGTFSISTMDDGITADLLVKIDGGEININDSFEGIEGGYVAINGGDINVTSTDDGINAASDNFNNEYINVNGGTIVINAEGDGIDSNGSATVAGGVVYVFGPTAGGNSALDSESAVKVTGGTVVAVSREAMDGITSSVSYVSTSSVSLVENGALSIDGVFTVTTPKAYSGATVIVCSDKFTTNTAYKLVYGSSSVSLTAKTGSIGGMGGGMGGPGGGKPNFR